ncbi:MAG TPA: anti-sigma factor [Pyrinomonadaceae bacterium]|nr:anti-sigma factor [Pyrinomonadaceae bacterium]
MTHQEYQDLLVLRALDALDASDARAIEAHLDSCAQCRAELIEVKDAAGLLAYAAPTAEPGAELRDRILKNIHSQKTEAISSAQAPARVVDLSSHRRSNTWSNFLRMAAAIAMVALLIGIVVLWRRDARTQREIAALSRQLNAQQDDLARDREALAMLTSPNMKRMELAGTKTAQNARGSFVLDPKTGHAMLLTSGLPATPPEMAYELWFIADGKKMPGKVFSVDAAGRAMISDQVPLEARERGVFAITLEPKQGVASPTGEIYLISSTSL